jgi:hypothetical protein
MLPAGRPPPQETRRPAAYVPFWNPTPWFHFRPNKHHRWSLDESQVLQYHLGGALHTDIRWWEAIDVPRLAVNSSRLPS